MAMISQGSLTEMMRLAGRFGLFETNFVGDQALVSPTEMRRYLFARDFSTVVLDEFGRRNWDFDNILPAINDGTFGVQRNLNWKDRAEKISEDSSVAQSILQNLAGAFLIKALEVNKHSAYGPLIRFDALLESLRRDGFVMAGGMLVAETRVIDIPEQLTEFEQALNNSGHDDTSLVLYHLKEAQKYQASEQWGAASGEWRHLFEESLRGAWRFTRANNPEFSERILKPPFRDILHWLEQAGFLGSDEKDAFGAGFGFLSVGNHPGLKDKQLAYLSQTLALPLAHACLLKLGSWDGRQFNSQR